LVEDWVGTGAAFAGAGFAVFVGITRDAFEIIGLMVWGTTRFTLPCIRQQRLPYTLGTVRPLIPSTLKKRRMTSFTLFNSQNLGFKITRGTIIKTGA
jgi:hypothetical protein